LRKRERELGKYYVSVFFFLKSFIFNSRIYDGHLFLVLYKLNKKWWLCNKSLDDMPREREDVYGGTRLSLFKI